MRDYDGEYLTSAYRITDFTTEPHVSDHERHMVELMLEDVARGITLDIPALPQPH